MQDIFSLTANDEEFVANKFQDIYFHYSDEVLHMSANLFATSTDFDICYCRMAKLSYTMLLGSGRPIYSNFY